MRDRRAGVTGLLVLTLALAGCGQTVGGQAQPGTTPPTTTSSSPTTESSETTETSETSETSETTEAGRNGPSVTRRSPE